MQLKRHSCPRNYYQRESPEPSKKPWVKRFLSLWWWLDKWKQRHNVTFKDASGEVNGVTSDMTSSCSETYLPAILSKYELKDIYNAEEFGFFYEALPEKSLHYRDERCGGKHSKRKLIGLAVGKRMGGGLPLLMIRKFAKPPHRPNICSWNICGGFPLYIPRILRKSSRGIFPNNVPGI